ncbi:MAG: hemolysin III family protein [Hyphomonadaceae bacterium]
MIDAVRKALHMQHPHYPSGAERVVDRWVHIGAIAAAGAAAAALIGLAIWQGGLGRVSAISIYAACWIGMLVTSLTYNLTRNEARRPLLRRFDHAAIFLMIAGSYTPFTTQRFEGAWAYGMTIAVWAIAILGAAGKLFLPGLSRKLWIGLYLLLGWIAVLALEPFLKGVSLATLILLVIGGGLYTLGVCFYVWEKLPYRRAVWHGFVAAASGVHYAAILVGVVLAPPPPL